MTTVIGLSKKPDSRLWLKGASTSPIFPASSGDADSWPVQSFQGCGPGGWLCIRVIPGCTGTVFTRCFVGQEAFSCAQKRCLWLDGACVPPTGCEAHHVSFILPINDAFKKRLSRQLTSTFLELDDPFCCLIRNLMSFSLFDRN